MLSDSAQPTDDLYSRAYSTKEPKSSVKGLLYSVYN